MHGRLALLRFLDMVTVHELAEPGLRAHQTVDWGRVRALRRYHGDKLQPRFSMQKELLAEKVLVIASAMLLICDGCP